MDIVLDAILVLPAIPGFKGLVFGVVYGGIKARTFNPIAALKKIGWMDYLSGYASGFIGGWIIFGLH